MLIGNFIILGGGLMSLLGIGISMYGGKLNRKAIQSNGGFMPVYNPATDIPSPGHLPFWFKEDVNNFDLCDIYYKEERHNNHIVEIRHYSKGDVFIDRGTMIFRIGILVFVLGIGGLFL